MTKLPYKHDILMYCGGGDLQSHGFVAHLAIDLGT